MDFQLSQPLVTVYIPTHNRASLVCRAVESVLQQSYSNIEIIVIDDGSTDNTYTSLRKYIATGKVVYLKNETPCGAPHARNRGIKEAEGEFITGLDDDDYFLPNRIEEMIKAYQPDTSFVTTAYKVLETSSNRYIYTKKRRITFDDILMSNVIGNQIFVKTDYLRELNGFDETLPAWQDYDMWIRVIRKFGSGQRISCPTYAIDKSHPHERISNNMQKICLAYDHLIKKHPEYRKKRYQAALKASLLQYDSSQLKLIDLAEVFLAGAFKRSLGLILMKLRSIK